ncbi:hypothetical protein [Cellulomonas hominis]
MAGIGLVRTEYGETKRKQRTLGVPPWLADALLVRRDRMAGRSAYVFDNPLQHGTPRDVSRTTKLFRRLQVLQDHHLARRRVSTTAADLLPAPR